MKSLSLLVKPASGLCNMKCDYCFYREEMSQMKGFHQEIMSDAIMELLIQRACESADDYLQFTFQGGEPTLAGPDFYRRFTDRVKKIKKRRLQVSYSFQTNGILLDENWLSFFRENQVLVGLSFDGTAELHDRYRRNAKGGRTAGQVLAAWDLLQKEGIAANLLCVVTKQAARKPERVYRFMRKMGAEHLQFIPCMDFREACSVKQDLSPSAADYAYFLKGVFDLWYQEWTSGYYVSVRQFDDYICALSGRSPSTCSACGECGAYLVVENDGSVYPCDFYVEAERRLGNIADFSLEALRKGEKMKAFLSESAKGSRCKKCRFYRLCKGGCRHDYISVDISG
ncbi:MAG: SPASM domain-containing protein, partial [Lachnospiraceae bacterium]|nr:SPASM domain-containing protein [Lachnospiraceae bacterium]